MAITLFPPRLPADDFDIAELARARESLLASVRGPAPEEGTASADFGNIIESFRDNLVKAWLGTGALGRLLLVDAARSLLLSPFDDSEGPQRARQIQRAHAILEPASAGSILGASIWVKSGPGPELGVAELSTDPKAWVYNPSFLALYLESHARDPVGIELIVGAALRPDAIRPEPLDDFEQAALIEKCAWESAMRYDAPCFAKALSLCPTQHQEQMRALMGERLLTLFERSRDAQSAARHLDCLRACELGVAPLITCAERMRRAVAPPADLAPLVALIERELLAQGERSGALAPRRRLGL